MIDTNVLVVAEGVNDHAPDACRAACVSLARNIQQGLVVALDSEGHILDEYIKRLRPSKTSGIGVKLVVALQYRHRDETVCRKVDVTPIDDPAGSYEEVPSGLRDFDIDDQVFIAVAAAESSCPQIFTAIDGEWWDRKQDFVDCGLDVQFLCASHFLDQERA